MKSVFSFYVNELIGKEIVFKDLKVIGTIKDLIVSINCLKPKVYAVEIDFGNSNLLVEFSSLIINKEGNQYFINCDKTVYIDRVEDDSLFLSRHVIDKNIIDIKGKKLARVKDIQLIYVTSGAFIVGVEVGFKGILDKALGKIINRKLINWDQVEKIDFFKEGIKVCKLYSRLKTLKTSDVVSIINELENSVVKTECA